MANSISVRILQIGDGPSLPTAQTITVGVNSIKDVVPTQDQAGGGTPNTNSRYISDPAIAIQVYARIDQDMGEGRQIRHLFSSELVAAIQTKQNAALA